MIINNVVGREIVQAESPQAKNYTTLPPNGNENDIAILNGVTVTNTVLQRSTPSNPTEGTVWITTDKGGNITITLNSIKVQLSSAKQYTNGGWKVLEDWFVHNGNKWVRGRVYLIKEGNYELVTMSSKTLKKNSDTLTASVVTDINSTNPIDFKIRNTASSTGVRGCVGLASDTRKFASKFKNMYVDLQTATTSTPGISGTNLCILSSDSTYVTQKPLANVFLDVSNRSRFTQVVNINESSDNCYVYIGLTANNNSNSNMVRIYNLYLE